MTNKNGTFGGFFKGLSELIERLGELDGNTGEMSKSGTLSDDERGIAGIYGFSVKVGLGGAGSAGDFKIEPFGNLQKDRTTGKTTVTEIREPLIDVFEEDDHILVVAEMPGISSGDITAVLDGDILTVSATTNERPDAPEGRNAGASRRTYRKEILLPRAPSGAQPRISCNNGVVEIELR